MKALLGTKIGMTQIIDEAGVLTPVTLVQAGPVTVTQVKTTETDGYNAVQVAYGQRNKSNKALTGHIKKSGAKLAKNPIIIKEFRDISPTSEEEQLNPGSSFDVSIFELGDIVKVTGTSKGKGFAGNVKRHNFNTSKKTHGGNGNVRKAGSIGSMYPQKVFKGKKMAGRMGHEKVTVRNLKVAFIDIEQNLLGISGAIPGPRRSIVMIQSLSPNNSGAKG